MAAALAAAVVGGMPQARAEDPQVPNVEDVDVPPIPEPPPVPRAPGAWDKADAWLVGKADFGSFVLNVCAHGVGDKAQVIASAGPSGASAGAVGADVAFAPQSTSFSVTKDKQGRPAVRLTATLPTMGMELSLRLHGSPTLLPPAEPGFGAAAGSTSWYISAPDSSARVLQRGVSRSETRMRFFLGTNSGPGSCYVTPLDTPVYF